MEQVCLLLAPTLYCLVGQALHLNELVVPPQDPERNWPAGQVARAAVAHVLQLVALLVAVLNLPDWQVLHLNPLLVPPQDPERYWPAAQELWAQALHLKPLLAPLHEPVRYWPVGQEVRAQVLQLVAVFVPDLYLPDWQVLHEVPERYWPSPQRFGGGGGGLPQLRGHP